MPNDDDARKGTSAFSALGDPTRRKIALVPAAYSLMLARRQDQGS